MNFSIILKILREGILAALMGGFYLDFSEDAHFINIVHIYLWLLLFGAPVVVVMDYSSSVAVKILSSCGLAAIVLIIKLITNRLHFLFDTSEAIEVVKKEERSKEENELMMIPFAYNNDEIPRAAAVDQESMFQNGSIDDIQNAQIHRDASKLDIIDHGTNSTRNIKNRSKDSLSHSTSNTKSGSMLPKNNNINNNRNDNQCMTSNLDKNCHINRSSELCILEQVSRRPSFSRATPRINSTRSRRFDNRKGSCPLAPNVSINAERNHPKLIMNQRSTREACQAEIEKMKQEISQLPIMLESNFQPSTADLQLLDRNPSERRSTKSIFRSRSSSQRYCCTVHTVSGARVGSMRASKLAKITNKDNIQPLSSGMALHHLPRQHSLHQHHHRHHPPPPPPITQLQNRNRRRQSLSGVSTRPITRNPSLIVRNPVMRSQSMRQQANHSSTLLDYPPFTEPVIGRRKLETTHLVPLSMITNNNSNNTIGARPIQRRVSYHYHQTKQKNSEETVGVSIARRTQSFKTDNSHCLLMKQPLITKTETKTGVNNSEQYRRNSLAAMNSRRQNRRASSIDIGPTHRPIFTIGCEEVMTPISQICDAKSPEIVSTRSSIKCRSRKASLDTKSHSLEVPETRASISGVGVSSIPFSSQQALMLYKQNSLCDSIELNSTNICGCDDGEDDVEDDDDDDAMCSTCQEADDDNDEPASGICELDHTTNMMTNNNSDDFGGFSRSNNVDEMLAKQLSMEDEEISALLLNSNNPEKGEEPREEDNDNDGINNDVFTEDNEVKKGQSIRRNTMVTNEIEQPQTSGNTREQDIERGTNSIDLSNVGSTECNIKPPPLPPKLSTSAVTSTTTIANQASANTSVSGLPKPLAGLNPATHEDTSEGSVHLFQDESGQWMVYVFGDDSGVAIPRRNYLENLIQSSTKDQSGKQAPLRCDSPHPDVVDSLLPTHTTTSNRRYNIVRTNAIRRPSNPHRSETANVSIASPLPNEEESHLYQSISSDTNQPPQNSVMLRNRRRYDNNRRISNASIEQISILDRILMTNSASNTGAVASNVVSNIGLSLSGGIGGDRNVPPPSSSSLLNSEQYDLFQSLINSTANSGTGGANMGLTANLGAGTAAAGTSSDGPFLGASADGPFLAGNILNSGTPSANHGPDSIMIYDALEKWFLSEKSQIATKHYYYELPLLPWSNKKFRVNFDRLQLTALFDRTNSRWEVIICVLLAALVSIIGLSLLNRQMYHDMSLFIVCFTMASAQYSLVKSVQPDACSPQHGFNRILVFSRAVYFCLIAGTILLLEIVIENNNNSGGNNNNNADDIHNETELMAMTLFGAPITGKPVLKRISVCLQYLVLFLPMLHTLGLLPQLNTMLLFLLEQLDIHIFGSTGSSDIASVSLSVLRNVVSLVISFPLCYFALESRNPQSIFYSIFWGIHLSVCYLLSRMPNSIHLYTTLLSCCSRVPNKLASMKKNRMKKLRTSNKKVLGSNIKNRRSQDHPNTIEMVGLTSERKDDVRSHQITSSDAVSPPPLPAVGAATSSSPPIDLESGLHDDNNNNNYNNSNNNNSNMKSEQLVDPLPQFMNSLLLSRIKNDLFMCLLWSILGFAMHISSLFTQAHMQWVLRPFCIYLAVAIGFCLHYLWPQLSKPYPWLIFTQPLIKGSANGVVASRCEGTHYWLLWLQKNAFIPLLVMNEFTNSILHIQSKFGSWIGSLIIIISSMKLLRCGFNASPRLFLVILLTHLLFEYDFKNYPQANEMFPLNYMLVSIIFSRLYDFWLKMNFVFIYIAPFQISWGSAFHAVAQLAFLPHSMFLMAQCVLSTIISAPLEPFLASAIFISSYVRPIKFWEKKYKTQRLETTNTALSSQMHGISSEQVAGNLNSIFYEHLTRSLQKTLAGDLLLGRWGGSVEHGDMFILASEDLHFLVHIIEVGNGCVTFQLRGLEFAGTYCHEQETEELRTDPVKNRGFCCCHSVHLPPRCLSLNVAFRLRWVAWQFVQTPFSVEGYRVTDHSATTTVQLFELRKLIVTLFVQCIIYYTVTLSKTCKDEVSNEDEIVCAAKIHNPSHTTNGNENVADDGDDNVKEDNEINRIIAKLQSTLNLLGSNDCADLDPVFNKAFDDDFDEQVNGVTRTKFINIYGEWIKYCLEKNEDNHSKIIAQNNQHHFNSLCYALSLVGRRSLGYTSSYRTNLFQQSMTDVFLHGLHDVFKGDVRVSKDDWIFEEVTLLQRVITPAVRIALKLYQDNLANPLTAMSDLYQSIVHTQQTHIICHETEPQWRFAILNDAESLFSFRRIVKPNSGDGYRIIMFNKKSLQFKVIKINRECVRGLWSSQQREQIFLRNNDQERGSIQHARQVLRNLVNSSCDLPIGYPIYVSEPTTSLAGSHLGLRSVAGHEISSWRLCECIGKFGGRLLDGFRRYRRCMTTTGGGAGGTGDPTSANVCGATGLGGNPSSLGTMGNTISSSATSVAVNSLGYKYYHKSHSLSYDMENNIPSTGPSTGAGTINKDNNELDNNSTSKLTDNKTIISLKEYSKRYKIAEASQILDRWHDKLVWPKDEWKHAVITSKSINRPLANMIGHILHKWTPFHPVVSQRSFCHLNITLFSFVDSSEMVLVFEKGLVLLDNEDDNDNND